MYKKAFDLYNKFYQQAFSSSFEGHLLTCIYIKCFLCSFQTYSTLPYGTTAYHLAVTLSSIASPAVCILALFVSLPRVRGVIILVCVGSLETIYLILTASMSPSPPFIGTLFGEILIVSTFYILEHRYNY